MLLAMIMILSVLSGCGGNGENTGAGQKEPAGDSGKADGTAKAEEPLALTLMLPIFKTNYPKDGSPVAAKLEEPDEHQNPFRMGAECILCRQI